MRLRWEIAIILVIITFLFTFGCSSVDSLVRSVENTFGGKHSEIDTEVILEAKEAYSAGNIILAEERYKEYVERNQRSGDKHTLSFAYSQLGRISHEKSDFKASSRYFEKAIELDPENLDTRGMYGESLYWQKEYIRAETIFRQALQDTPNDARFQIMLGRTMAQQKQYIVGQRYLKQALGEQGAYEEMAILYNNHNEYEMADMAMNKARESHIKQRQIAASRIPASKHGEFAGESGLPNIGNTVATPRLGQHDSMMNALPSSGVAQSQPYPPSLYPSQTTPTQQGYQQGQLPAQQQIVRQPQNVVISQQNPVQNYQVQQQSPSQYLQQPTMSANQDHLQPMMQNQASGNPAAVQQVPYSGVYQPQQTLPHHTHENNPQWSQDNRPPYGFAVSEQPPVTHYPLAEPQMIPSTFRQNSQEIAYSSNHSLPQSGISQTPMLSSDMSSPTNPLADNTVPIWQHLPMQSQVDPSIPITGWQNNQLQNPAVTGF